MSNYSDGMQQGFQGLPRAACNHPLSSKEYRDWNDGYNEGAHQRYVFFNKSESAKLPEMEVA